MTTDNAHYLTRRVKRPCMDCPFRTDTPTPLPPGRATEAVEDIVYWDGAFACHKTYKTTKGEAHCAGSLIVSGQMPRPARPSLFRSLAAFAAYHDQRTPTC